MNAYLSALQSGVKRLLGAGRRSARGLLGPLYRPVRRTARFVSWAFPALGRLLLPAGANERRLLMIYDLSSQPFSIGDILVFQEASLVLRKMHNLGEVDFAIVYDPKNPGASNPEFASITETNVLFNLASILPVAQVNENLGSLLVFNSYIQLHRFIADNGDFYHIWPSGWHASTREYLYYSVFNDLLYAYYRTHGSIPRLGCRPFLVDWALLFYKKHAYPQVPVTVNIRNNKALGTHRNLDLEIWLQFFQFCETRYPAKFVVICARSEIDDRLRRCQNVIVAKDYHTGVEQDLALIHASAIHMGASSGPATMAWFSTKPYLIVNTDLDPDLYHPALVKREDKVIRFAFATPAQCFIVGAETTDLLIREFARMWEAIDVKPWQSESDCVIDSQDRVVRTWLR